jgi:MinD superfamily P-loop ATPase
MEEKPVENNRIKLAIASGKGGTGKTMISTSLYYSIKQTYNDVVLVDCDAEEPNSLLFMDTDLDKTIDVSQKIPVIDLAKCTFCGKCHDYCNYNAIFIIPPSRIIRVIEELCHSCGACLYACKYGAISEKDLVVGIVSKYVDSCGSEFIEARMNSGIMTPVPVVKAAKKHAFKKRIQIMDSPPGTSCPFIHTVSEVDYVILVTEPTIFGLSDLKQTVETLKKLNKYYGVIINKSGIGNDSVFKYLEDEDIELLAEIPFDREIAELYSSGKIVSQYRPDVSILLSQMFTRIIDNYGNSNN